MIRTRFNQWWRLSQRAVLVLACVGGACVSCLCLARENELALAVREKIRLNRPVAALVLARELAEQEPNSSRALSTLATALYRNGDFEQSEKTARAALKRERGDADALVVLARCLRTRGMGGEARRLLERAVEIAPHHPLGVRLLSGALDLNEERARTLKLARLFVKLDPPGQALFVEHLRKMVSVVERLGDRKLNILPEWKKRPEQIVLPMRIFGSGPRIKITLADGVRCWCLLDTGEESITLARHTAQRLKTEKLVELPTATATGIERMGLVLCPRVQAEAFVISNVLCAVGTVNTVGPGAFRGYRIKVDFSGRRVVLTRQDEDAAPADGDLKGVTASRKRVRFRRVGRMVWFPIRTPNPPQALRERPAWGLLDTGCEPVVVLTPRYLKALKSEGRGPLALPIRASFGGAARERGKTGIMKVLPSFSFLMLDRPVTVKRAMSAASIAAICRIVETEFDMVVGWPVLRDHLKSIEIDYERCVLTVEPR